MRSGMLGELSSSLFSRPTSVRLTSIVILPLVLLACATEPEPSAVLFRVKVDSLSVASIAKVGDTIKVRLYGTIGGDGCHSFSHFDEAVSESRIDLAIWGKRVPANICPTVMVYLNGKEYRFVASKTGTVVFTIRQPDGSTLQQTIEIVP